MGGILSRTDTEDQQETKQDHRKLDLKILTRYSASIFLLATNIEIGGKLLELAAVSPSRSYYVLKCKDMDLPQLHFEPIGQEIAAVLKSCGVSRVGMCWSGPSPVFQVDFESQTCIQSLLKHLQERTLHERIKAIISTALCRQPNSIVVVIDIGLDLLQVLPNSDTKHPLVQRVTLTNYINCIYLWEERGVFDMDAVLREFRTNPNEACISRPIKQVMPLFQELKEIGESNWLSLGLQLGVPVNKLRNIHCDHSQRGVERCMFEMLYTWLNSHDQDPTWAEVVSAVSRTGNNALAKKIASKYGIVFVKETGPKDSTSEEKELIERAVEKKDSEVHSCTRKVVALEDNISKLQQHHALLKKFTDELFEDKHNLETKLQKKEHQVEELQDQEIHSKETIHELEIRLIQGQFLEEKNEKLKAKVKELKLEIQKLNDLIATKQKEITSLQQQNTGLNERLQVHTNELSEIQEQLQQKNLQLCDVQDGLAFLKQERDKLKQQLQVHTEAINTVLDHPDSSSCESQSDTLAEQEYDEEPDLDIDKEGQLAQLVDKYQLQNLDSARILVELMNKVEADGGAHYPLWYYAKVVKNCSTIEVAIKFYFSSCIICLEIVPVYEMISIPECDHSVCKGCFKKHFTLVIKEMTVKHLRCPVCGKPEVTSHVFDIYLWALVGLIKEHLERELYERCQEKLRDFSLLNDPYFCWCANQKYCKSGFLNINDELCKRKIQCPHCNEYMCFQCKKTWEDGHEKLSCKHFAENASVTQEYNMTAAAHLNNVQIACPQCHTCYNLARGRCMHFQCMQCPTEFCGWCGQSHQQEGLWHANHARDCLFHLRDFAIEDLKEFIRDSGIKIVFEEVAAEGTLYCQVKEADKECGKEALASQAGLCVTHFKEYLLTRIMLDPITMYSTKQIKAMLLHEEMAPPERGLTNYRKQLIECVKEKLPLQQKCTCTP